MKKKLRFIVLAACVTGISIPQFLSAQQWCTSMRKSSILNNWSVNVNTGLTSFFGDLSTYDNEFTGKLFKESGPAGGVILSKLFNDSFGISGQFLYGSLKGANKGRESFKASFYEYNFHVNVYLIKLFDPYGTAKFDINLFAGIGQFKFKTTKYNSSEAGTTTYVKEKNKPEFTYLVGLGTYYKITDNVGLTCKVALRQAQNDYLDYTVNNDDDDFYSYLSVGVTYYIESLIKTRYKKRYSRSHHHRRLPLRRRR